MEELDDGRLKYKYRDGREFTSAKRDFQIWHLRAQIMQNDMFYKTRFKVDLEKMNEQDLQKAVTNSRRIKELNESFFSRLKATGDTVWFCYCGRPKEWNDEVYKIVIQHTSRWDLQMFEIVVAAADNIPRQFDVIQHTYRRLGPEKAQELWKLMAKVREEWGCKKGKDWPCHPNGEPYKRLPQWWTEFFSVEELQTHLKYTEDNRAELQRLRDCISSYSNYQPRMPLENYTLRYFRGLKNEVGRMSKDNAVEYWKFRDELKVKYANCVKSERRCRIYFDQLHGQNVNSIDDLREVALKIDADIIKHREIEQQKQQHPWLCHDKPSSNDWRNEQKENDI